MVIEPAPIRILLIDDDPDDELLTAETLAAIPDFRYSFTCVTTATDGIAAILADLHDVYLLDRHLGAADGIAVLTTARAAGSKAPILLLTGLGNREVDRAAMMAGASDYLPKAEMNSSNLERAIRHAMDRAQMLRRLEARTAELVRSNRELEEFAAVISHDLRAPMQTIAAHAQLLEQRYQGRLDPGADQMIERLVNGVMRLERMLSELLAFARVSTPTVGLATASLDVCLDGALNDLATVLAEQGGQVLRPSPLPVVPGNQVLLTQLFANLVGNALKFRGENPAQVEISARRVVGAWAITVADNGVGIPAGELERVFTMFHRSRTTADRPGTGIGLSICKKIVERHGGTITAASPAGGGARFTFTLPLQGPEVLFDEGRDNPPAP